MAFIVFICFRIIDLLRLLVFGHKSIIPDTICGMGLLLFFVILLSAHFYLYRRMKLVSDAETIRKVAYTDALTGIEAGLLSF